METGYGFAEKYTKVSNTTSNLKVVVCFSVCKIPQIISEENLGYSTCICLPKKSPCCSHILLRKACKITAKMCNNYGLEDAKLTAFVG